MGTHRQEGRESIGKIADDEEGPGASTAFVTSAGSDFFCSGPHVDDIISGVKQASVQNTGQSG